MEAEEGNREAPDRQNIPSMDTPNQGMGRSSLPSMKVQLSQTRLLMTKLSL